MSYRVLGLLEKDQDYQNKLAAYEACIKARVCVPEELENIHEEGEVDLIEAGKAVESGGEGAHFFDVDIDKLPKGVKTVRFELSW